MKNFRHIALTALLTIGSFAAITYTSCTKDDCKNVTCQNGGTCSGGNCSCPTGYQGTSCETRTRDLFIGTYSGTDICNSGTYTITLTVGAASSDVQALVNNPGGFGSAVTITGTVSGTGTISFANQNVGSGRTLNGTMAFSSNTMTFNYTVTPTVGASDNCTGAYTKQ